MWNLEDRGPMMIEPGWKVYKGMIVGEHTRDNDLEINVLKGKQLTNIRTTSKDEAVRLTPPIQMTLEKALAYIEDDELVEVTPKSIRLRNRNSRASASAAGCSPRPRRDLVHSGLKSMVIWALSDNDPAMEFYRALGGRAVARSSEKFGVKTLDKVAYAWQQN
jgi:hypothetical protein